MIERKVRIGDNVMPPIIGILSAVDEEFSAKLTHTYVRAIESAGGVPVVLPYAHDAETIASLVDLCDGILFTGGCDVAPSRYGALTSPKCEASEPLRDSFELSVFKKAIEKGAPTMGICRGEQLINVALGGTLYQDIPSEFKTDISHRQSEPKNSPSHPVSIEEGTPLFNLIKKPSMAANTFHHQAIKELGEGLRVMARADDGMIEAVYLEGENYLRAYQWHPERLFDSNEDNKLLFLDFINAAKEFNSKKKI